MIQDLALWKFFATTQFLGNAVKLDYQIEIKFSGSFKGNRTPRKEIVEKLGAIYV